MSVSVLRRSASLAAGALLMASTSPLLAADLSFTDFSGAESALALNGSAAVATDSAGRSVLRLTPAAQGQAGSSFSLAPILLTENYAFSTRFTFNINNAGGLAPADGLVFVIQPNSNSVGTGGSGLGIAGIPNSFGVEFDTFPAFGNDPARQHVAIDFGDNATEDGDIISSATAELDSDFLASGTDLTAWIDYDGSTVEVRLANGSGERPLDALLSYDFDLASVIGEEGAYVGFTAGTGSGYENHDIVSWQFRDAFEPLAGVPEPATWATMLLGFALIGSAARRRRGVVIA